MFQPAKWWAGLPVAGVLWLLANSWTGDAVEKHLAARAAAALPAGALDGGKVSVAGRDATLSGMQFDAGSKPSPVDLVLARRGIRLVNSALTAPPVAKPYGFSAALADGKLVLTGAAPNPQVRANILAGARAAAPGAEISDRMTYAAGQADNFDARAAAAIASLADLRKGTVALSDDSWSVNGEAASLASYEHALESIRKPAAGLILAKADILAPEVKPYLWSAATDGKTVALSGFAPATEARAAAAAKAAAAFPGLAVDNKIKIGRGAAEGLAGVESAGLDQLALLSSGEISISDSHVAIKGVAKDGASVAAIGPALAAALPKGFDLAANAVEPPAVHPYVFAAGKTADGLRLSGYSPAEAARRQVLAAAKVLMPQAKITDDLKIAGGMPAGLDYAAATGFALQQLSGLATGKIGFSDRKLSLAGEAGQSATAQAVTAALAGALPGGLAAGETAVKDLQAESEALAKAAAAKALAAKEAAAAAASPDAAPVAGTASPSGFAAVKTAEAVTLSGVYRDDAGHRKLQAQAARNFSGLKIVDQMQQSDTAPANLAAAAERGLQQLARLDTGTLTARDGKLQLDGDALFAQSGEEIKAELAGDPVEGYAPVATLGLAPPLSLSDPAACKDLFAALSKRGVILFETGKAAIDGDSSGFLDYIAANARRCPDARIEIGGHTDSDGNGKANLDLSQRRAEAVAARLAKSGLPAANMVPKGYGDTKPVASNETPDGKAQNRRIEFAVTD